MAKERLSKLQSWVLTKWLEGEMIHRNKIREFYGKECPPSYKDKELSWGSVDRAAKHMLEERAVEKNKWDFKLRRFTGTYIHEYKVIKEQYITTKAEEVTITRTFSNLKNKGLLEKVDKWGYYYLSEKGFLIAKSFANVGTFVNYKKYKQAIDEKVAEMNKSVEQSRKRLRLMSKGHTEEEEKQIAGYETKLKEYENQFNVKTISELCCDECLEKIVRLQKDSGVEEVKALKQEVEALLKC